ncbi:hypothetical protein IMCC1933_29860 [Rhodobacteraceae bacterium IMCC1933]|nr:hypothetical protein [Rhodobacteraceae bacterium IMCC1923]MDP4069416.1 hypothetical protein [Rhodobacteraceae bacterium IMCC1933]
MTLPSVHRLYQATNTTWPARRTRQEAGWEIRDGAGGGKRVSAVTLAQKELPDIDWIEATLTAQGQEHLFMIRDGDEALDASLAAHGYEIIDPVILYLCETAHLRPASLPWAQSYCIWEPLHIMREIWAAGGIQEPRIALMHRVQTPKTALLARSGDTPAGVGFLALDGEIAMLHAVEVLPSYRRRGVAKKTDGTCRKMGGRSRSKIHGPDDHPRQSSRQSSLQLFGNASRRALSLPHKGHSMTYSPTALDLPMVTPLPDATQKYFDICQDKLGMVPNVLQAYAFNIDKLNAFTTLYNDVMLADSGLSKLEREMIAVVVSSINKCFYCLTAHGATVRALSGDPILGEQLVMNYRTADLDARQKAMLDFAALMTESSQHIEEADRAALRAVGFSDRDIWDISAVAGFFNMTNRIASATDMRPNTQYHAQHR